MRSAGREDRRRIASLVLVAVIAALLLPFGARALAPAVDAAPARRVQIKRLQVEARPVAARRPLFEGHATLPAGSFVAAAFAVIGLVVVAGTSRLAWSPSLRPVQRGPPSSR